MKSLYRSIDNSMHEQLDAKELKKIENYFGENFGAETHFDSAGFDKACREYEASLCTIPCSNPHSWEDGKEYEEGKDYEIRYKDPDRMDSNDASPVASPLSSNDEDELKQAIILLEKSFMKAPEPLATEIYEFIKRVTRITKKP